MIPSIHNTMAIEHTDQASLATFTQSSFALVGIIFTGNTSANIDCYNLNISTGYYLGRILGYKFSG